MQTCVIWTWNETWYSTPCERVLWTVRLEEQMIVPTGAGTQKEENHQHTARLGHHNKGRGGGGVASSP